MVYELYIDSLLLLNFVLNLYLLLLVRRSIRGRTSVLRLILGAGAGAVLCLLPFLLKGAAVLRFALGAVGGCGIMTVTAFPVHSFREFWTLLKRMVLYGFVLGGTVLFLFQRIPFLREQADCMAGVMGVGAAACFAINRLRARRVEDKNLCFATLVQEGGRRTVSALIDSGNSLVEPVSGRPVSVIDRQLFNSLWHGEPPFYYAIPYHSVGTPHGIMKGYLLDELIIEEPDGLSHSLKKVCVAVRPEKEGVSAEPESVMILNPALLAS